MEHDFFWLLQRKMSGNNGTTEKVVLFFRTEYSEAEIRVLFFQAIQSGLRGHFPVNGTDLHKW